MIDKVIIAGKGGQGIEMAGELLARAAVRQGLNVTHFPSYGAQVRGGHAYCHVVLSREEVYSPIIEEPLTLIALEQDAYEVYSGTVRQGGVILANTSLVEPREIEGVRTVGAPATEKALEMGNVLVANMVIMGAYYALKPELDRDAFIAAVRDYLTGKKAALFDIDKRAFEAGLSLVDESAA